MAWLWQDGEKKIAAKLQAATERLNELRAEQRELSLAVAVEEDGAEKKPSAKARELEKVNANITIFEQNVRGYQDALSLAKQKVAEKKVDDDAEAARLLDRQIGAAVDLHEANSNEIQKSVENLVAELAIHYTLNKQLVGLVFKKIQASDLSDQDKQQRINEANRLLGLFSSQARLRYFAHSYRLPNPLPPEKRDPRDSGISNFSLSTWLNAPPHDMNVTNKGLTFSEIEKEIVALAVFNEQPKPRPKLKIVQVEAESVRMDGSHLPEGPKRDLWLRNFNPELYKNRFGLPTREPSAPKAPAYETLSGRITDDPKIIEADKAERARKKAEQQQTQNPPAA